MTILLFVLTHEVLYSLDNSNAQKKRKSILRYTEYTVP